MALVVVFVLQYTGTQFTIFKFIAYCMRLQVFESNLGCDLSFKNRYDLSSQYINKIVFWLSISTC